MIGQTMEILDVFIGFVSLAFAVFALWAAKRLHRAVITARIARQADTERERGVPSIDLRIMQDGTIVYMASAARLASLAQKSGCRVDRPDLWHPLVRTADGLSVDCRPTLEAGQPWISHAITTT